MVDSGEHIRVIHTFASLPFLLAKQGRGGLADLILTHAASLQLQTLIAQTRYRLRSFVILGKKDLKRQPDFGFHD